MQISGFPATNPIKDFRPDGGAITLQREIVKIENCNSCHNQLALHGGGRIETKYCVTCHNPGSTDPDTGNTVDFKVMVHKIHYGEDLPSVAGPDGIIEDDPLTVGIDESADNIPYQIIGYGGSVHDYSTVVFPQDIRNCTKCHDGDDPTTTTVVENPDTPQGNNWKTKPSEEACGACHDDIYFGAAPVGFRTVPHPGGSQTNAECFDCHVSGGFGLPEWEVEAAHANPVKVAEAKFEFDILSICGTPVGSDPDCPLNPAVITVEFSVSDPTGATTHGHGNLYDVAGPTNADRDPEFGASASLNILTGWDSSDYTNVDGLGSRPSRANSLSALTNAVHVANGVYTIDLAALPVVLTSGSGVVAIEGHPRAETVIGSGTFDVSIPVRGEVAYFGINGSAVVERRVAVDIANKCDNCHDKLSLHGNNRADNAQLCVICHNPRNTDIGRRDVTVSGVPDISPLDGQTEEAIDFKILIHSIHAAQKDDPDTPAVEGHGFREKGIVVYGYGNNAHDYGHVRFPGILNDCTTCHNTGTYELSGRWATPLQNGILATTVLSSPTGTDAPSYALEMADQTDDLYSTPTAAVCSACHDGALSQEHMEFIGGAKFDVDQATIAASFETCSVCHGPGNIADVKVVHGVE